MQPREALQLALGGDGRAVDALDELFEGARLACCALRQSAADGLSRLELLSPQLDLGEPEDAPSLTQLWIALGRSARGAAGISTPPAAELAALLRSADASLAAAPLAAWLLSHLAARPPSPAQAAAWALGCHAATARLCGIAAAAPALGESAHEPASSARLAEARAALQAEQAQRAAQGTTLAGCGELWRSRLLSGSPRAAAHPRFGALFADAVHGLAAAEPLSEPAGVDPRDELAGRIEQLLRLPSSFQPQRWPELAAPLPPGLLYALSTGSSTQVGLGALALGYAARDLTAPALAGLHRLVVAACAFAAADATLEIVAFAGQGG